MPDNEQTTIDAEYLYRRRRAASAIPPDPLPAPDPSRQRAMQLAALLKGQGR